MCAFTSGDKHADPMAGTHGGVLTTVLDSAMGSAITTKPAAGQGYTTLVLKVNSCGRWRARRAHPRRGPHAAHEYEAASGLGIPSRRRRPAPRTKHDDPQSLRLRGSSKDTRMSAPTACLRGRLARPMRPGECSPNSRLTVVEFSPDEYVFGVEP